MVVVEVVVDVNVGLGVVEVVEELVVVEVIVGLVVVKVDVELAVAVVKAVGVGLFKQEHPEETREAG